MSKSSEIAERLVSLAAYKANLARKAADYEDQDMFEHADQCNDWYDAADDEIAQLKDRLGVIEDSHALKCKGRGLNLSEY